MTRLWCGSNSLAKLDNAGFRTVVPINSHTVLLMHSIGLQRIGLVDDPERARALREAGNLHSEGV